MTPSSGSSGNGLPLRVSFIIPAMNEASLITAAIDSIRRQKQSADIRVAEVIVVDAGSTDGTAELARAAGCRVVTAPPGNVAVSRNRGAMAAEGNVLAFVDADCELPTSWLTAVCGQLRRSDVAAAGMQMAPPAPVASWVERTWYELVHRTAEAGSVVDAEWLATFNLAVRSDAFRSVNGFDEHLITCEDVDLSYRLRQRGRLRFVCESGVVHHGESRTVSEFFRRESWRARGGWMLLRHHHRSFRELLSTILPFVAVGGLLSIPPALLWAGPAALAGALPLAAIVVRRRPAARYLAPAVVLQAVYCAARCCGLLYPSRRVERRSPCCRPDAVQRTASSSIMWVTGQDSKTD